MDRDKLNSLFSPKSLAVIGASVRPKSLGRALMQNILNSGYEGNIYPINPKYTEVFGKPCYSNVKDLPSVPDLGVICTPAKSVPQVLDDLGQRGTKAVVIIPAGFVEGDNNTEGIFLEKEVVEIARSYGLRFVGPNCLGIINTAINLNATFSEGIFQKGDIALVSQSGAILDAALQWGQAMGIGFSKLVSVGEMGDLTFADYLEYLKEDPETKAIILYIEAIKDGAAFISMVKKTVVKKPVIVMKAGRFQGAQKAVRSHSGALAGNDDIYEAVFRDVGAYRIYELQDLYDLLFALNVFPNLKENHLTIITNGGGAGILAADKILACRGELSTLSPATVEKLNEFLPPLWSHGNPIDIIGDASAERYEKTLNALLDEDTLHNFLIIHCPTLLSPAQEVFQIVHKTIEKKKNKKPVVFMVSLQHDIEKSILTQYYKDDIPIFPTPERAVQTFLHLLGCRDKMIMIDQSQPKPLCVSIKANQILDAFIKKEKDTWLDHHTMQEMLRDYNLPILNAVYAASPLEAKKLSEKIGFPLALKATGEGIIHKSDLGGVILNLNSSQDVYEKAKKMQDLFTTYSPSISLQGFLLQPMLPLDHSFELFLGGIRDKTFGPMILFGAGGKAVELVKDRALGLVPLTRESAFSLMKQTKIYEQLKGYRDQKPIPLNQLADCLVNFSYLIYNHPKIIEVDINPLFVDSERIVVMDTRMKICQEEQCA